MVSSGDARSRRRHRGNQDRAGDRRDRRRPPIPPADGALPQRGVPRARGDRRGVPLVGAQPAGRGRVRRRRPRSRRDRAHHQAAVAARGAALRAPRRDSARGDPQRLRRGRAGASLPQTAPDVSRSPAAAPRRTRRSPSWERGRAWVRPESCQSRGSFAVVAVRGRPRRFRAAQPARGPARRLPAPQVRTRHTRPHPLGRRARARLRVSEVGRRRARGARRGRRARRRRATRPRPSAASAWPGKTASAARRSICSSRSTARRRATWRCSTARPAASSSAAASRRRSCPRCGAPSS